MAYDPELADRIRRALAERTGVAEKAMFGGLSFLLNGKTFCGIVKRFDGEGPLRARRPRR